MVGQAVTGINLQAQAGGIGGRFGNTPALLPARRRFGIGIAAGVNFDIRANVRRRFNLRVIRIDKQRNQDTGIRQALQASRILSRWPATSSPPSVVTS
jgi:hypothetical protein